MAVEFDRRGWQVAGCSRTSESFNGLRNILSNKNHLYIANVSQYQEVDAFAAEVLQKLGIPNLLVNNAGIINGNANLTDVSPDEFLEVLKTNLCGIHNMIRSFVPSMTNQGKGKIINFSSYWGQSTAPEVGPYCASKWGVEGLTRSLAQELPNGLVTISLNPGIINTDMLRSCFGQLAESYEKPEKWAKRAVDRMESLKASDSGATITI